MASEKKSFADCLSALSVNSNYINEYPSREQALRLFDGEWISKIPVSDIKTGEAALFDDARITWLIQSLGGVEKMKILELGPFEAGHTSMFHAARAGSILAIEANVIAFMKCLVIKEVLELTNAEFRLGNFEDFIAEEKRDFDLVAASGVLYHLVDPLSTLLQIMKITHRIFIWSHFFDEEAMPVGDPRREPFTGEVVERVIDGHSMNYHLRSYGGGQQPKVFCGGLHEKSVWLELSQVRELLEQHGFKTTLSFDHPGHQNGPCACILAIR